MIKLNITDKDIFEKIIKPLDIEINDRIYPLAKFGETPNPETDDYAFINEKYELVEMGYEWKIQNFINDPKFTHIFVNDYEIFHNYLHDMYKNTFLPDIKEDTPYYIIQNGQLLSTEPFMLQNDLTVHSCEMDESLDMTEVFADGTVVYTTEEYQNLQLKGN